MAFSCVGGGKAGHRGRVWNALVLKLRQLQAYGLHGVRTAVAKGNVKNENDIAIPEDVQNAKDVQHVDDATKV